MSKKSSCNKKQKSIISNKSKDRHIESEEEKVLFPGESQCAKKQKIVVSEESGKKHVVKNPHQHNIYQYHFDGGIKQKDDTSGERCDYIVEVSKKPKPIAFIIELKGSNLLKAVSQIIATIKYHQKQLKNYEIIPRIVCTYVTTQDIYDTRYIKFKEDYPQADQKAKTYIDII